MVEEEEEEEGGGPIRYALIAGSGRVTPVPHSEQEEAGGGRREEGEEEEGEEEEEVVAPANDLLNFSYSANSHCFRSEFLFVFI